MRNVTHEPPSFQSTFYLTVKITVAGIGIIATLLFLASYFTAKCSTFGWTTLDAFIYICESTFVIMANFFVDFCAIAVPCYKHHSGNYRNLRMPDSSTRSYTGNFIKFKKN
jgi:hypothetical protein